MTNEGHSGHHVVPKKLLITIFAMLVGLTILTVFTAQKVDIGAFNLPLALAIAGVKAFLVVTFFMALKYDTPVNALILTIGILFVTVFLSITLLDTLNRGDMANVDAQTISDAEGRNLNTEYRAEHADGEAEEADGDH